MKLRLNGNALRLRLSQAEVAQFSKTGYVESATEFGPACRLSYILESSSKAAGPQVLFGNGDLRIQVPASDAQGWITTDRVGMSGEQQFGAGKTLSILIEKDFQCIHSERPDPDAYPNPTR